LCFGYFWLAKSPEMPVNLILFRHARSEWTMKERITGSAEPKLSPEGIVEAKSIAEKISEFEPSCIFSSEKRRAKETTDIVLKENNWNLKQRFDEGFNEQNFGLLEGFKV
jgi:broad specificity phosphatase PhoE